MELRRGATLTTADTLGLAESSDLGPTAGNGFLRQWPDDLATIQVAGITDVRLSLDWARLQPKQGVIDGGWADQYEQILMAAEAIGLAAWATLFEGSVPRWFDNEGGLSDDAALIAWWPRFVERAADRFGGLVAGWTPFASIPPAMPDRPWLDTWGILGGGGPPVVASIAAEDLGRARRMAGSADRIGIEVGVVIPPGTPPDDRRLGELQERWGESIAGAARDASLPAVVTVSAVHDDPEVGALIVTGAVGAARLALADGVEVPACFVDPGIAGPDRRGGLFEVDRSPLPALAALLR